MSADNASTQNSQQPPVTSHGTAIELNGKGILLRGSSGSGKSSIALRLLDDCLLNNTTGFLVADDRFYLEQEKGALYVSGPENLRGLIEIRGLGIVPMAYRKVAKLDLVVDLVPDDAFERHPEEGSHTINLQGVSLARIHIVERNPDAAAIIRMFFHTQATSDYVQHVEI